jgi:glycoside/pentoside/hexuronide:cation symporter, GPH family
MAEAVSPSGIAATAAPERPSLWTKLAYGFGAVAFGVKNNGFDYFVLIFYSQVIGIDARLVGLAITMALIVDAVLDLALGYWSDNLRSRWGRRHPFMYVAAIPVAATYFLLWNPPAGWSEQALFLYLLCLAVTIRVFIAVYEVPSSAMAAELSRDYDQRSSLIAWRYYFGWTGGNVMSVMNFMVIFPFFTTAAIKNGQFNRDAYEVYGVVASALMLLAILVSAVGTHSRIAHMPPAPPKRTIKLGTIFKETWETLANRSFAAIFGAATLFGVGTGMYASLAFYFSAYFFGFTPQQIGWITMSVFLSAIIGSALAPFVTRTIGKKLGAILMGLIGYCGGPLIITLRLLEVLPPNGHPFVFWFYLVATTFDLALIICFQTLSASMLADLVEQAELKTGRRSEGLFFAAATFIRKSVQGFGVIAAGLVLTAAQFPKGANPAQVPDEALYRLGAYYVPTMILIWVAMVAVISTYKLSRDDHEENLRKLAAVKAAGGGAGD